MESKLINNPLLYILLSFFNIVFETTIITSINLVYNISD